MEDMTPFYIGEVTPEKEVLFVNREDDLELLRDALRKKERRVAIPVIGDVGIGKTSFLNMVRYYLEKEGLKVEIVKAKDILIGGVTKEGRVVERDGLTRSERWADVLLVDDVEKMEEEDAIKVYQALNTIADKMKIAFTGRKEWLSEVKEIRKAIKWLTTVKGRYIYLELTPEDMAYFLEERFNRLRDRGYENRFEHDALILAAKRANGNLRDFFEYCSAAYDLKKEGRITEEVMKEIILEEDLGIIEGLSDMGKNILRVLITEGEKTNKELKASLKEMMEEGYRNDTYYEVRRELEKEGFIRVERKGKKTIIRDVYSILNIEITEEMIDKAEFYARKIRDSYIRRWRERDRSERMYSHEGRSKNDKNHTFP